MKDKKDIFELNEQELDCVVGGFNNDMIKQLNLKVLTRPGKSEISLNVRYGKNMVTPTSEYNQSTHYPLNEKRLQSLLDSGYTNFQVMDNNNNWVQLSIDQVKALIG